MSFVAPGCSPAQSRWLGLSVALTAVVTISACVRQAPIPAPIPPLTAPNTQGCGAEKLTDLKGKHFSALAGMTFPGALRILYPMQAITMDFSPTRLNARVDGAGIIRALTCG